MQIDFTQLLGARFYDAGLSRLRASRAIQFLAKTRDDLEQRIEAHLREREELVAHAFSPEYPPASLEAARRRITTLDQSLDRDMTALDRVRSMASEAGITLEKLTP